jgi:hypothetical protein
MTGMSHSKLNTYLEFWVCRLTRPSLVALSMVLSVLVYCAFSYPKWSDNYLVLTGQIKVSKADAFQMFYDLGTPFSEQNSRIRMLQPSVWNDLRIPIPPGELRALRIDPVNQPHAQFEMSELVLSDKYGNRIARFHLAELGHLHAEISSTDPTVFTTPGDPNFLFAPESPIQATQTPWYFSQLVILVPVFLGVHLLTTTVPIVGSALLLSWLVSSVFSPGFFSPDSISQIEEALSGQLSNWHPPVMATVLSFAFHLGLSIEQIILVQSMLFLSGVALLINRTVLISVNNRKSGPHRELIGGLWLVGLLLPITPLAAYMVTLWKDCWYIICILWLIIGLDQLSRIGKNRVFFFWGLTGACILLAATSLTLKHNTLLLLPFYAGLFWVVLREKHLAVKVLTVCALIALVSFSEPLLSQFHPIRKTRPLISIFVTELAGMAARFPESRADFPFVSDKLVDGYESEWDWGNFADFVWRQPPLADPSLIEEANYEQVKADYFRTARQHPLKLALVKWSYFYRMLGKEDTYYWFHNGIAANTLGIRGNDRHEELRSFYIGTALSTQNNAMLRQISGVHLNAILLAFTLLTFLLLQSRKGRSASYALQAMLVFSLLHYSLYILATPSRDFRYLYPGMLVTQIVAIGCLSAMLIRSSSFLRDSLFRHSRSK